jgi:hypothetical protein
MVETDGRQETVLRLTLIPVELASTRTADLPVAVVEGSMPLVSMALPSMEGMEAKVLT